MQPQIKYRSETRIIPFDNGSIRITNHKPILSPKEMERRKREAELRLFEVFSKYSHLES